MPTQILPAASLRSARCLPAARTLLRVANYLICIVLWSIGRAICRVASNFLPALREGEDGDRGSQCGEAGEEVPVPNVRFAPPSRYPSALHQLDADAIGCSDVAQEAAVYAVLQLDGKSNAFGPKLGAKGRQIALKEKTEPEPLSSQGAVTQVRQDLAIEQ